MQAWRRDVVSAKLFLYCTRMLSIYDVHLWCIHVLCLIISKYESMKFSVLCCLYMSIIVPIIWIMMQIFASVCQARKLFTQVTMRNKDWPIEKASIIMIDWSWGEKTSFLQDEGRRLRRFDWDENLAFCACKTGKIYLNTFKAEVTHLQIMARTSLMV